MQEGKRLLRGWRRGMTLLHLQGVSLPKILARGQGQRQGPVGALGVTPVRDDGALDPGGSPWGRRWAGGGASGVKVEGTGLAGRLICRE